MSDRIRRMIMARQNAMMALAQMGLLNMNRSQPIQEQLAGEASPEPEERSMARQILDRYMNMQSRTIQERIAGRNNGALMAPMIASVMQLDR
jgi:hypothetical protein